MFATGFCTGILAIIIQSPIRQSGRHNYYNAGSRTLCHYRAWLIGSHMGISVVTVQLIDYLPPKQTITVQYYGELNHPTYCLELAPSDYYLFRNLKCYLLGTPIADDELLVAVVET